MLPDKNTWAAVGAVAVTILIFVLQVLLNFFNSGVAWPVDVAGWAHIVVPSIVAGALAALTPRFSANEARFGYRKIGSRDAPVANTASEHFRVRIGH